MNEDSFVNHQWGIALTRESTDSRLTVALPMHLNELLNHAASAWDNAPKEEVFSEIGDWADREFRGWWISELVSEYGVKE